MKPTEQFVYLRWNNSEIWLWALILAGLTVRVTYPFLDNPLHHLVSDPERHYDNATKALNYTLFSVSDALGYQLWLGAAARIFGRSLMVTAAYSAIMSGMMAYIWYLWFKLCLPSRKLALIAYAMIAWLPDWIKIYSYFMEETLLLPVVGLAFMFAWKAKKTLALKDCLWFGFAAGASFITKASSAPAIAIAYIFVALSLRAQLSHWELFKRLTPTVLLSLAICALAPISFHSRTYAWTWALPAQSGVNKLYYESGRKEVRVMAHYFDRYDHAWRDEESWFGDPPYYTAQLWPFSTWSSPRKGAWTCRMDFYLPAESRFLPKPNPSFGKRVMLTLENWIYLFIGFSWPTEFPPSKISFERYLWPFFTLAIVYAAVRRKRLNQLDILCLGTLLVFMFQQECVMCGRYRMYWEGTVIPTFVLAISDLYRRRRRGISTIKAADAPICG